MTTSLPGDRTRQRLEVELDIALPEACSCGFDGLSDDTVTSTEFP